MMGTEGNVVLIVDKLIVSEPVNSVLTADEGSSSGKAEPCSVRDEKERILLVEGAREDEPLLQTVECRICQDEDNIKNMETPCACSGSLKYAHRLCVQKWCDEKGDITCEICRELYKPGYTAAPRPNPDETVIDISGGWDVTGTPFGLHDPRFLAMAAAQHHFLEAEYDDYAAANCGSAAFCRSAAIILMALLLLRHAVTHTGGDGEEDDASTYFSVFLLRAAGFLLPCYIMAWAISTLQRRRQRQEAAALAAAELAFILRSRQGSGLHLGIAPETPSTPQQEPPQHDR